MLGALRPKKAAALTKLSDLKAFDNHELVIALNDEDSGLKAYIAVHSSKLGPAHGGTRMKAYTNELLAIQDVLELSRAMSYKSALAGLPYGGAKGVIVLPEGPFDREKLLRAYAKRIESMHGTFRTGTDVGLTDKDTQLMAKDCQYILGIGGGDRHGLSTSKTAAMGVQLAIKAAAKHKYGSDDLKGKVIGIKGLGKLGAELAVLLGNDGASLVVADINADQITDLQKKLPNLKVVPAAEIHKHQMNIYAPCALGHEFMSETIRNLKCDIIAGGANNQLIDDQAGDEIFKRGILYAPDYIANAGGLIYVSEDLETDGFHLERVQKRLENIRDTLGVIFKNSERDNKPTHRVSDILARKRIDTGNK